MTHIAHLFFLLIPIAILIMTLWAMWEVAQERAVTYRQRQRRSLQCWGTAFVGVLMAAPFVTVSVIAFT